MSKRPKASCRAVACEVRGQGAERVGEPRRCAEPEGQGGALDCYVGGASLVVGHVDDFAHELFGLVYDAIEGGAAVCVGADGGA